MKTNFNGFLTLFLALLVQVAFAQEKTVTGVVSEESGPLPGVTVLVKGTTKGTQTDFDGKYTIKAKKGDVLLFSYVGMKPVEKKVDASNVINVSMKSANTLGEVLVVAYGTAKKSSITGAVSSVKAEDIAKTQTTDVAKAIEGSVAGVVVSNRSGQPGTESTIRIRGIGSINASSNPLIILDGAPYSGELSSINNNDIESFSVLKDAASAALYGARGANGVIIITTKKGKKGKMSVKFESRIGVNQRGVPEYDIMNSPAEYYETFWEAIYNKAVYSDKMSPEEAKQYVAGGKESLYKTLGYNIYNVDNDKIVIDGKMNPDAKIKYEDAANFNNWAGNLFSDQMRQEHNLSITNKTDKGSYYFSLGYLDDEGYNQNSFFERYSTRFSYDGEVLPWLKVSTSSMLSKTAFNVTSDGGAYSNPFQWTRSIAPIYPIYVHDASGKLVMNKGKKEYDWGDAVEGVSAGRAYGSNTHPIATQKEDVSLNVNYYLTQTAKLEASITDDLTFTANGSFYGNWFEFNYFLTPTGGSGKTYNGISTKTRINTEQLNFTQILRYEKSIEDYNFTALLGHESYKSKSTNLSGQKTNFVDPKNTEWNNAAKVSFLNSHSRKYSIEGYFGQVTGDYAEKYYLSGSFRRDGSSVFHPDNRWGNFWSAGASWRMDKEDFMADLTFIDNLKLKVSYGVQGNDHLLLPGNRGLRSFTPYRTLYSITTDGKEPGLQARFKGRKEVTWEENANFNTGIEFSMYDGLMSLELDYFQRKTNNLLFNLPVPESTGFTSEPWNIGNMINKGFEFTLNLKPIDNNDFTWNISLNGLHFKNEILSLPEKFRKDGITRGDQRITEGGGIFDFYMVKWGGVNKENGDAQYYVKNAETNKYELKQSKDYDANSRQFIGSALPDLQGGFSTNLRAYGFDFGAQFSYQIGGLINDGQYGGLMHIGRAGNNWHTDIRNRWTPENKNSDIPRIEYNSRALQGSDRFITDASYIALRNISLGYTFPSKLLEKYRIGGIKLFMAADNVAVWSKRKGLDPRVSINGFNNTALYSPIRTMSAGLVLTL